MVEMQNQVQSHKWWFESHSFPRRSPWLQSTLAELDEKTATMLKLIEEDADSFAQRAEMYYKKRPELITMVENFYRAHRSLAERYDLLKSDPTTPRVLASLASPFSFKKSHSTSITDQTYINYSDASDIDELAESIVDDPEQEANHEDHNGDEMARLREEIERLKDENKMQKEKLMQKDEEKREVIRQLSLAVGVLKDENLQLKRYVSSSRDSKKKWVRFEFEKLKGGFLGRLFDKSASIVAL